MTTAVDNKNIQGLIQGFTSFIINHKKVFSDRTTYTLLPPLSNNASMTHLVSVARLLLVAAVALTAAPPAAALLLSPLLSRPWGVPGRRGAVVAPVAAPAAAPTSAAGPVLDFEHDDDLLRCKHELLGHVYAKSLARGFAGRPGGR